MLRWFFREFPKTLIQCWYLAVATVLQVLATLSAGQGNVNFKGQGLKAHTVLYSSVWRQKGVLKLELMESQISWKGVPTSQLTCKDKLTSKVKFRIWVPSRSFCCLRHTGDRSRILWTVVECGPVVSINVAKVNLICQFLFLDYENKI